MTVSRLALRAALRRLAHGALAACGTLALFALPGSAQQPAQQPVTLAGKVTNAAGAPLSQATVLVQTVNVGAVTRPDGSYTLAIPGARVPAGPVTVIARAVGFKPATAQVTFTPYFYLYKHLSHFVEPGARLAASAGTWDDRIAFKNPDGGVVVVVVNRSDKDQPVTLQIDARRSAPVTIPAKSFNTFTLPADKE